MKTLIHMTRQEAYSSLRAQGEVRISARVEGVGGLPDRFYCEDGRDDCEHVTLLLGERRSLDEELDGLGITAMLEIDDALCEILIEWAHVFCIWNDERAHQWPASRPLEREEGSDFDEDTDPDPKAHLRLVP